MHLVLFIFLKNAGNFAVLVCCAAENDVKDWACLTQNLVQNEMDWFLASGAGSGLEISKTKQCLENIDMRPSQAKGSEGWIQMRNRRSSVKEVLEIIARNSQ